MIVLHPTVVIGLGSSGARIVEGIQQRMYEMFKMNSLPIFEYVVLETNRKYGADATPSGQDINVLRLSSGGVNTFSDFEELLLQLERQGVKPDWINQGFARKLVAQGEGAGGVRPVGRLLLWANMPQVVQALSDARDRVLSDAAKTKAERIIGERVVGRKDFAIATTGVNVPKHAHAVVCGTATGGTYSGGFIDLGYLAQRLFDIPSQDRQSLYSITLLPPSQMDRQASELHRFKANAYGALLEESYFTQQPEDGTEHRYQTSLPGVRNPFDEIVPPYNYSYYISQEFGEGGRSLSSPDALCRVASLKVFCDLMGLAGRRSERIVDYIGSGRQPIATFGLSAILHPQFQISEYAACEAGILLCKRWTNEDVYVNNAGQKEPVPSAQDLSKRARTILEGEDGAETGVLQQRLNDLSSASSDFEFLSNQIEEDVERLLDQDYKTVLKSFVDPGDTYYGRIQRNIPAVTDTLYDQLESKVLQALERNQNLPYAIALAQALRIGVDELLQFWDALDVPAQHSEWSSYVSTDLYGRVSSISSGATTIVSNLITTRPDLLQGIILETMERLKVHLIRPSVKEVKERLGTLADELQRYQSMVKQAATVLEQRKVSIQNELQDDTLPIGRVYASETSGDGQDAFESDVQRVVSLIAKPQASASNLAGTAYEPSANTQWMADTFDDWLQEDRDLGAGHDGRGISASENIKLSFQRQAIDAIGEHFDIKIDEKVKPFHVERFFSRAKSCHLRYKRPDGRRISAGDYLVGPKRAVSPRVREMVKDHLGPTIPAEKAIEIPGVDHMLLYYREEIVGAPLNMLVDREDMHRCFEQPPSDPGMSQWVKKNWTDLRIAYDVPSKLERKITTGRKNRSRDILESLFTVIGTFVFRWKPMTSDVWTAQEVLRNMSEKFPIMPAKRNGESVAVWAVDLDRIPSNTYVIARDGGEPDPAAIDEIVEDARVSEHLVQEGLRLLRELGRDALSELWEEHVEDRLSQRYGREEARLQSGRFFGEQDNQGIIYELLNTRFD